MTETLEVLAGIAGSGKTAGLLERYRAALGDAQRAQAPAQALWLTPGSQSRAAVRERLLDASLPVAFGPQVFTFKDFADRILGSAPTPAERLTPAAQRTLLRRIVERLNASRKLRHFGGIAGTSGFLDVLAGFIAELKRGETWPDDFEQVCRDTGNRARDQELAVIYRDYQEVLIQQHLYDEEGRFWSAREALRQGHWGAFGHLKLIIVDGFSDFSRTQYEILQQLAERAGQMVLTLPFESPQRRPDLFAKSQEALDRLQTWGTPPVDFRAATASGSRLPTAFAQIAQWLFANPREVPPGNDGTGIEILETAGQGGEVQLLAARIKRLLLDGVPADDIVLAVRELPDYAELIDEVFTAAGIPFRCEAGIPLGRAPLLRFALNLLQLEAEDWPFRRLIGLVDSAFFRPGWPELADRRAPRSVALVLRALQLDGGREQILSRLRHLPPADPETRGNSREPALAAQAALQLLTRLAQTTQSFRRTQTLLDWAEALDGVVRELSSATWTDTEMDGVASHDRSAWNALKDLLFSAARAEPLLSGAEKRLSPTEFLNELTDLLRLQNHVRPQVRSGVVRVMPAADVRNLDIPRLFLAGLNESSFPQSRSDDCFFSETERRQLSDRGLWLGHRAARTQEEMLLFYSIVTRAREQLVLSYPVVSADGAPLSPSPYLTALRELFAPGALRVTFDQQLDPIPSRERLLSAADARVYGMYEALAHRPALFRSLYEQPAWRSSAHNVLAAVDMNALRFHTPGFTSFEGRLESPGNIEPLRVRFGPGHEFSATQLETYANCPFRFFLSQVLKIEPLAGVDVETDFGARGTLIHALLADLHREFFGGPAKAAESGGLPAGETVVSRFHELLHQKLGREPGRSELHQALLGIEERLLREWGDAFALQWNSYFQSLPSDSGAPLRPAGFEVPFGTSGYAAGEGTATPSAPALIFGPDENQVRVGGRIDRIDVGQTGEQTVFTVIDYKTGRRKSHRAEDVQAGRVLQLVLYGLAVQRLDLAGSNARPYQLGYWHIRETGFAPAMKVRRQRGSDILPELEEDVWNSLVGTLEHVVPRLAAGIREGRFFVYNEDENCTAFCPYATVCRVGQIRGLPDELLKRPDLSL